MHYDLALELKNAGFPQYGKGTWTLPLDRLVGRRDDRVYVPTLEELIDACGERFTSLDQVFKPKEGNTYEPSWLANSMERGSTATEAVARLWLALNQRNERTT
jgi:hypothetical protein